MMLKRRIAALENRLAGLARPNEKVRLIFRFACDPEPEDGERVLRFDFGSSEGEKK
jgi:hypothetical protein